MSYTKIDKITANCVPPKTGTSIAVFECFKERPLPDFIPICAFSAATQRTDRILIIGVGCGNAHTENILAATTKLFAGPNKEVILITVDPIGGHFSSCLDAQFAKQLENLRLGSTVVASIIWPENGYDIEAVRIIDPDFIVSMTETVYSIAGTAEFNKYLASMRKIHVHTLKHNFVKRLITSFTNFREEIDYIISEVKACGSFVGIVKSTGNEAYQQRMTIKTLESAITDGGLSIADFVEPKNRPKVMQIIENTIKKYTGFPLGLIWCQVHARPSLPV